MMMRMTPKATREIISMASVMMMAIVMSTMIHIATGVMISMAMMVRIGDRSNDLQVMQRSEVLMLG